MQKGVHLIPHEELRELAASATDIDLWCYLSLVRTKLWRLMADQSHLEDTAWKSILGVERIIMHLEGSETVLEAEIASRRILASLPRE